VCFAIGTETNVRLPWCDPLNCRDPDALGQLLLFYNLVVLPVADRAAEANRLTATFTTTAVMKMTGMDRFDSNHEGCLQAVGDQNV
jgi:hypothetical protein